MVGGLATVDVAPGVPGQRADDGRSITRAKKKIAARAYPLPCAEPDELPERLTGVLDVVHLIFSTRARGARRR